MAYVQPGGVVQYFGDLRLTPDYKNTLYFTTEAAKDATFDNIPKLATETNVTYIGGREHGSVFRSSLSMGTLVNCRYLRFKNTPFENKWFYCFVTSVDYANNGMVEVTFLIDDMVTWMGTFTLGQCLVVREHTQTDNLYEHLIDEKLPVGDYVIRYKENIDIQSDPQLVLSVARSGKGTSQVGAAGLYAGNILSGCEYQKFDISPSGQQDLQDAIDDLIDKTQQDAIISAMVVFGRMAPQEVQAALTPLSPVNYTSAYVASNNSIDGYTPKNYKLYNYPYCMMSVYNSEGSENEFRYEFFDDHVAHFYWFGIAADNPEACVIPTHYKNQGIGYVEDEMLVMKQFPQMSVAVDQYRAWVAQMTSGGGWVSELGQLASSVGGAALGAAAGAISGNPLTVAGSVARGVGSVASQALDLIAQNIKYSAMPQAVRGTAQSSLMMGINNKQFKIYHRCITADYARTIDDYFTAYGYQVNQVKTPIMANRPEFTYVETMGCQVNGAIPASAAAKIADIFNHGCRFWRNYYNIGNLQIANGRGGD